MSQDRATNTQTRVETAEPGFTLRSTGSALSVLCQKLFPGREIQHIAMIFVLPDCPIANSYAAEYSRLHAEFGPQGLPLIVVHADPVVTEESMQAHAQEYRISAPVVLDNDHAWVRRAGAMKTPEAVIFRRDGTILYRGRIDDRFAAVGKRRSVSTVQDLRLALGAVLSGQRVAEPWPEAVGCHIPELTKKD